MRRNPQGRFYLSKADKRGFAVVFALLLLAAAIRWGGEVFRKQPEEKVLTPSERKEVEAFEAKLRSDSMAHRKRYAKSRDGNIPVETFSFDPNTADSATLLRLGLKPWQVSNAMKYRRKGGRWKSAEHFSRLYGLSKADYERLKPYIRISSQQDEYDDNAGYARYGQYVSNHDTLRASRQEKLPEGSTLELNKADTTELKKIPGIGSYYASKICRYRERLGGFVSALQLREVGGLPGNIEKWFVVSDKRPFRKLNINQSDFKQLVRHPYLDYEQVKTIVTHIHKYGKLKSLDELRLYKEFTPEDLHRLSPYVEF